MYKIGFIDEDAGQRNHFYQAFKDDFVVHIIEPKKKSTEEELIFDALDNDVELLIIDYRMDDELSFNGDSVARKLAAINPNLPVIVLTSHEAEALGSVDDFRMVFDKSIWDDPEGQEFASFKNKLKSLINNYETRVATAEKRLKELDDKLKVEGLLPSEEDEYVTLNTFLEQVLGKGNRINRQFYSKTTNDRLDSLMASTKELLEKVKEVNASL
jgi:CheY-like chemotaxis protein